MYILTDDNDFINGKDLKKKLSEVITDADSTYMNPAIGRPKTPPPPPPNDEPLDPEEKARRAREELERKRQHAAKRELIDWALVHLGYPLLTVELTEKQYDVAIADALTLYTKYASFPVKYLAVTMAEYNKEYNDENSPWYHDENMKGVSLAKWNVTHVRQMSTARDRQLAIGNDDIIFGWPAFMNGQFGGLPYFGSTNSYGQNFSGSFVTYHNFREFTELARRLTGSNPDWNYDKTTKMLTIIPEPLPTDKTVALLEVECEPPIVELYQEEYFRRIFLAYCKIMLGTIRSKFGSVQLIGGGQINTDIGNEGREELNAIKESIMRDTSIGQSFYIS